MINASQATDRGEWKRHNEIDGSHKRGCGVKESMKDDCENGQKTRFKKER